MARDNPLISVVMTCYGHAAFVREAVNGGLNQTYSLLEIVIIDDCSPDETSDVIEALLARHPRRSDVRFIRNSRNLSGRASCLMGIDMTSGPFILHAHGDDVMLPE